MTALRKTPCPHPDAAPFVIRAERASDVAARETLLDASFGGNRHAAPASACARTARPPKASPSRRWRGPAGRDGAVVARQRRGHAGADARPARRRSGCRELGVGTALMDHALAAARARGHGAVILLGDAPYYARFGFSALGPAS